MSRISVLSLALCFCFINLLLAARAQAQGAIQKPGPIQKPGEIQQPKGTWQTPGEIQQPKGKWQTPGEIQVPRGIQAIKTQSERCQQRLSVVADALFEFDKATLHAQSEETLRALLPLLAKAGKHPISIEGHTDAIGAADYNQRLSEKRAQAVKDWLVAQQAVPVAAALKGYGKTKPVAPNTNPNGSDNPAGRQKNRRVEVVIDTCR
jgi:outer membrane protein OmpA-like peptidoglycan-associated protein